MAEEVHFWQLVRDETGTIKTWRLVDANPPTLKTWGRQSVEEIRGKTTDEIFGPGATEHYLPVVQKIMSEGVAHSFEDYFAHLDKHFRFTSVPLGDHFITTGADITAIKKAQESLNTSLAEKEVLLKEIHHRVKNNMQVISSLVALQADRLPDDAMRAVLQDVTHRVRSMALVHEKLYQSADMARVEFAEYAQSLLGYLWRAHGTAASGVRLVTGPGAGAAFGERGGAVRADPERIGEQRAEARLPRPRPAAKWPCRFAAARTAGCASACATTARGCRRASTGGRPTPSGLRLVQILAGQLRATVEVSKRRRNRVLRSRLENDEAMSKTTILIVEDEAIVAADLAGKLRRLGYEVAGIAAEGEEAVALACRLASATRADGHLAGRADGRHRSGGSDPPPARRAGDLPDGPFRPRHAGPRQAHRAVRIHPQTVRRTGSGHADRAGAVQAPGRPATPPAARVAAGHAHAASATR